MIARVPQPARLGRPPQPNGIAPPVSRPGGSEFADQSDILRTVAFYLALAVVFIKFSMLSEIQAYLMHFRGYLLYIFGVPAMLALFLTGGVRRTISGRPAYYWIAFALWMVVCVPFSTWRGSSFQITSSYIAKHLILMFMIAGLMVSWREYQMLVKLIGLAAVVNLLSSRIFATDVAGRLYMEFGTVGNANDLAGHLLLTLPFLLLAVYLSKSFVLRGAVIVALLYGVVVIARTGSRGALVAMAVDGLFLFWRGSIRQRLAVVCLVPLAAIGIAIFVPSAIVRRLHSFSSTAQDTALQGAAESSETRRYLLTKGAEYAIQFPIFGLGPGQFANYEGGHNILPGFTHGSYHDVHNSYLAAFTEMGLLGGILHLAGYISAFLMLNQVYRKARDRPDCRDIQSTVFCVTLGLVGFCVAITFLNFTYFYYGPALAGMAISINRAANREFSRRKPAAAV